MGTRAGVRMDRAACAWLVRRFLDPAAESVSVARRLRPLFDGLYEYHRRRLLLGREPA